MWKYISHHEFTLGILILIFCTIWLVVFLGDYDALSTMPIGFSWLGLIFIFDFFDRKYFYRSVIPDGKNRKRKFWIITVVSILFCVLLEITGVFVGRLWYYPFMSMKSYLLFAPFAFGVYTLLLFILYEFLRDFIASFKKIDSIGRISKSLYSNIMHIELILGIFGYFKAVDYILNFLNNPGLSPFIISQRGEVPFPALFISGIVGVSTFFIFEFICFKQNKQTLTHDILGGNFWPIVIILLANTIAIITIEFANGPLQIWVFSNWPLDHIRILNIPVMAIFAWPFQFPVFLSMLRALFPSKEVVW